MDRIVHPTAVDLGGGKMGFRSKDTVAGVPGTVVTATHLNAVQEELLAVIEKAGLAPSAANLLQLVMAVRGQQMNYRVAGGTANALTVTLDPPITAYSAGLVLRLLTGATSNSGPMTVNVDAVGAVALVNRDGTPIAAGQIAADSLIEMVCAPGPTWRVMNIVPSYEAARIAFPTVVTYATPGTFNWTVPASVTKVRVRVWGGGGSGGNGYSAGGGGAGGGGAGYTEKVVTVVPGAVIPVTVGAGGAAPASGIVAGGLTGGASSFGPHCSATGGGGGNAAIGLIPGSPSFSLPGTGAGGDLNIQGTSGGSGANGANTDGYYTGYGGLGGTAPFGGSGGCMTTGSSQNGGFPGGGGSGGGSATGSNASGGAGGSGCVIIEFVG